MFKSIALGMIFAAVLAAQPATGSVENDGLKVEYLTIDTAAIGALQHLMARPAKFLLVSIRAADAGPTRFEVEIELDSGDVILRTEKRGTEAWTTLAVEIPVGAKVTARRVRALRVMSALEF